MKTRKVSTLVSKLYDKSIKIDAKTDHLLSNPTPHVNKKDDLCNDNKCINPELKKNGFGQLPRSMMPQFPDMKSIKAFVRKINEKIGPFKHGSKKIPIYLLHPTQSEISKSRVQDIFNKLPKNIIPHLCKDPILTSFSGSVIDGHHRTETLKLAVRKGLLKRTDKVTVYAIDLPPWLILSMANTFGYNKNSQAF